MKKNNKKKQFRADLVNGGLSDSLVFYARDRKEAFKQVKNLYAGTCWVIASIYSL